MVNARSLLKFEHTYDAKRRNHTVSLGVAVRKTLIKLEAANPKQQQGSPHDDHS